MNMQSIPSKSEAETLIEYYETAKKRLADNDFSPDEEDKLVLLVVTCSLELVCLGYQLLDKHWVHPTEAN